jgi:hypothetical protein
MTYTHSCPAVLTPVLPRPFSGPRPLTPLGTSGGGRCDGDGGSNDDGGDSGNNGTTTLTTVLGKGSTPWSSFYNRWTDTINMLLGPSRTSVQSRPSHTFFATLSMGPPFTPPLAALPLPRAPPPQQQSETAWSGE